MTLSRFITISEAAERLHTSEKDVQSLVQSGKLDGGILPDGETMVVIKDSLPTRKEDLPEYKKNAHLKGVGIGISDAARKYDISISTVHQWAQNGYIARLGMEGKKVLLDEADVAYCVEIYNSRGATPKRRLFNPDGTPYKPKTNSLAS